MKLIVLGQSVINLDHVAFITAFDDRYEVRMALPQTVALIISYETNPESFQALKTLWGTLSRENNERILA